MVPVSAAIGGGSWHTGIDIANPAGGFVFAAGDGRVAAIGRRGDYGLTLELDHGAGVHTLYAHLSQVDPRLRPGVGVASGTAIARMGATGNATGVHLHYEVMVDGEKVDPLLLRRRGAPGRIRSPGADAVGSWSHIYGHLVPGADSPPAKTFSRQINAEAQTDRGISAN